MLFLLSPRRSQQRPRLMEAKNLPLTSARFSWRLWYQIAFLVSQGSASPSSWQSTPIQLQARAQPWLSFMLLQTCKNLRQQSMAFLGFLMLSYKTPMEQQDRPSSLTLPALLHPKANIQQSLRRRITEMYVPLSTFYLGLVSSSLVRFRKEAFSCTREGVLKKRGNSMR